MCSVQQQKCCHVPTSLFKSAEGRLGMSDVTLLSGISGLSFDSHFLPPLWFFCLVLLLFLTCHFSANGPFSCLFSQKTQTFFVRLFCMALFFLLMVHSPACFPRKLEHFLLGFFVWLLSSSQMIVGRWYVQLAAIWPWYLLLSFYIVLYLIISVHSILIIMFL